MPAFVFDTTNPPDFLPEDAASILAVLPLTESGTIVSRSGESIPRPNRELALAIADLFSDDEAQSFYHLAVLVTKLK